MLKYQSPPETRGNIQMRQSLDFVTDEQSREERKFYDQTYAEGGWCASQDSLDAVDFPSLWKLEPGSQAYLASLRDVRGRTE